MAMTVAVLILAAGCVHRSPRTATVIEPPQPLAVPPPPPRVILPPEPEAPPLVEDPQPASPTRPRVRTQPRNTDVKTEPPKTETPPETHPPTPETPAEKPNQDLQPADAAGEAAIRQQIGRARQDLSKVNYTGLSNDMKTQYDQASRFLALSEQNLKEHNLLFASTLADKAGAIAEMLIRR
jgi:outer membrane biosynthesis protein TonB